MREAFDAVNPGWEITCTLLSSYWYMQNFDLESMQKHVSFFNMISYDLHGMWYQGNKYTGSYLRGYTKFTEIDIGMDLLWRNNIDPKKVVMAIGFYGRSFTMSESECYIADYEFSAVGGAGPCSQSAGILYYLGEFEFPRSFDLNIDLKCLTANSYNTIQRLNRVIVLVTFKYTITLFRQSNIMFTTGISGSPTTMRSRSRIRCDT